MQTVRKKGEIREKFPFLLWASSLAAILVIMLTVLAFYFVTVQHEAEETNQRSVMLIRLTDSLSQQLHPPNRNRDNIGSLLKRMRELTAGDDQSTALAEKIFRMATDNLTGTETNKQLFNQLEYLHTLTLQASALHQSNFQAEGIRLEAIMIGLTALILVVISFFTGISLGELKHRYKAYRREQELNKMKSHFVSIASHEFRTPLSSIQLSVSLIDKYAAKADCDNIQRQSKKIRATIANLTGILEDFLSLEKLETGKITPTYQRFDLLALCQEIMEEISMIAFPGQELKYKAEGIKETVNLDKNLLHNTILNLLSNAVKYSGETSNILLQTVITGKNITIKVTDDGAGIPPALQKNLFTPFYRVNPNATVAGTGLGLSIVKKYVELMNGSISFSSTPGQQTCFQLVFPAIS